MKTKIPFSCANCGHLDSFELSIGEAKRVKKEKKVEVPTPYFEEMVAHMDKAWFDKKQAKFNWEGRFFKDLKGLARNYSPFGVMALYDLYLSSNDDWARSVGYSFPGFISSLPKLLDQPGWKKLKNSYEEKYALSDPDINAVMGAILKTADKISV